MKTALVTGGAGFIGSHMAEGLLKKHYQVVILDNLSTGKKSNIPQKAIFVEGDVRKKQDVEGVFKKYKIDIVLHIAGHASTIASFMDPLMDVEVNFLGTMNVVLACIKYKASRFLYASSMTVYGNTNLIPVKETGPINPISYYGITKYAAERFVHSTAERSDLPLRFNATSFRMFNVYGPRQSVDNPYQGVLAIFIGNVMRGEPITIFGDGEHTRDFIYVQDVVDCWITAINNKKSFGKVFNIGFGEKTSINNLARMVIKAIGFDPKKHPILYKDARPGDQRFMQADINLTQRYLGFKPKIGLSGGLKLAIDWAKSELLPYN